MQTDIVSPVTEHIKLSDIQEEKNIQDLSIKQMKEILRLNRVDFKGCVEKDELKSKIMQLWSASRENAGIFIFISNIHTKLYSQYFFFFKLNLLITGKHSCIHSFYLKIFLPVI